MNNVVIVENQHDVLRLTLNRPERLNGFTNEVASLLLENVLNASCDNSIKVVVITGTGTTFSCGMDLDDLLSQGFSNTQIGKILDDLYNPLIRAIIDCPKPVLCGLNGVAAGGAVSLALACDVIIAHHSARFISAFSRIGLMPDCGGSWLFPHAFGLHRAKTFAMMEHGISAEQAYVMGVVSKIAKDDEFAEAIAEASGYLASASPQAMRLIKRSFHSAISNSLASQLTLERKWQDGASREADFREGVTAFQEKRKPSFKINLGKHSQK
ncbi:MAG: enoyl-CoA hydratase-related protein [Rhizobiaceae bacterium]